MSLLKIAVCSQVKTVFIRDYSEETWFLCKFVILQKLPKVHIHRFWVATSSEASWVESGTHPRTCRGQGDAEGRGSRPRWVGGRFHKQRNLHGLSWVAVVTHPVLKTTLLFQG